MSTSGDIIPNNIDTALLSEPTIESRHALGDVFDTLTPLAQQVHTSEFSATFPVGYNETIEVYGGRSEWRYPNNPEGEEITYDDLVVVVDADGPIYRFGTGMAFDHENLYDILTVSARLTNLYEDVDATWLRNVMATAMGARDEEQRNTLPAMTDLLNGLPAGVDLVERMRFFVSEHFENGSRLVANWSITEEDTSDTMIHPHELSEINLVCPDGSRYSYAQLSTGEERLFIKKPGDSEPDTTNVNPVVRVAGFALGVGRSQDLMRELLEKTQARKNGVDVPTEGGYRDLLGALKEAFDSGLVLK